MDWRFTLQKELKSKARRSGTFRLAVQSNEIPGANYSSLVPMGTISQFGDLASRMLSKSYCKLIPRRRSVHSALRQHQKLTREHQVTGGATVGLGGTRTSPLFENMGLVICPNLHRNSEDGMRVGMNYCLTTKTQQHCRNTIRKMHAL